MDRNPAAQTVAVGHERCLDDVENPVGTRLGGVERDHIPCGDCTVGDEDFGLTTVGRRCSEVGFAIELLE